MYVIISIAKCSVVPPSVTINGSSVVRVSLSDSVELSVDIQSTEAVHVQWLFLYEIQVNSLAVTNTVLDGIIVRSTLRVGSIRREELGDYLVSVSNSAGQSRATITVELNIRK